MFKCYLKLRKRLAYLDAPKRSHTHVEKHTIEHRHGDELRAENCTKYTIN